MTLLTRHDAPDFKNRSGVSDLFVYALDAARRPLYARFVEVNKPEQDISKAQLEEIAFMRHLRLQARVLRLIER